MAAKADPRLWRAYLLKEGLRYAVNLKGDEGKEALDRWLSWARRSRMPVLVELGRKVVAHRAAIEAMMDSGLTICSPRRYDFATLSRIFPPSSSR